MSLFNKDRKPFLQRVVDFDVESRYTPKVRVLCHVLLWGAIGLLSVLSYLRSFSFGNASLFALRNIACDIIFFYFFFYYVVVLLLDKNHFLLFFVGTIIAIYLWILSNYCIVKMFDIFISNENKPLHNEFHSYAQKDIFFIISLRSFSSQLFVVLSFVSVPSFIKIVFDITKHYSRSIKERERNQELEIEKIDLEKDFLLLQLNPHFLFNTFNNLYALAIKQSPELPPILERLSDIMRYTVYEVKSEKVSLLSEIDFIENYISLERLRHSDNCDIQLILNEDISSDLLVAPLLFFPFVENAFKYGLKSDCKFIRIYFFYMDDEILFRIENDILTDYKKEGNSYSGVGIQNVKKRLELLYKNKYRLDITNVENIFIVDFRIQIR
ncbi:MAG: sensor histidine kinase [Chitinophagaceae bacterium]